MFVNLATVAKKKKVENKSTTNKSKGKSNINNNSNPSQYSNLYCAVKIREKSITHNVICPSFEELSPDFFEDNKIEVSIFLLFIFCVINFRIMKILLMRPI